MCPTNQDQFSSLFFLFSLLISYYLWATYICELRKYQWVSEWAIVIASKARTCNLGDGEAEADGGVGEGHDGSDDGKPPDLVEVGQLREQDLDACEDDHVGCVGGLAVRRVTVAVEAVGSLDRPATRKMNGLGFRNLKNWGEKHFICSYNMTHACMAVIKKCIIFNCWSAIC